jgi:hypothetical protein
MNELLKLAVDGYDGLARWNRIKTVKASMSVEGALSEAKGHLAEMKDLRVEARLQEHRLVIHYVGFDKRSVFTGSRVNVETENGRLLDFRENPRSSYAGHVFETPWDDFTTRTLPAMLYGPTLRSHFSIPTLGSRSQNSVHGKKTESYGDPCRRPFRHPLRVTHKRRSLILDKRGCSDDTSTRLTF